jgi:hypothetical protein
MGARAPGTQSQLIGSLTLFPVQLEEKVGAGRAAAASSAGRARLDAVVDTRRVAGPAGASRHGLVRSTVEANEASRAFVVVIAVAWSRSWEQRVRGGKRTELMIADRN